MPFVREQSGGTVELQTDTITFKTTEASVVLGYQPILVVVYMPGSGGGNYIYYNGTNVETSGNFSVTPTSTGFSYKYLGSGIHNATYWAI